MTVTFFLSKHQDVAKFDNPAYNPAEPEDPIYNPRYSEENIFPQLNVSNVNAIYLLSFLGYKDQDAYHGGKIEYKDLDDFCRKITKLQSEHTPTNPKLASYLKLLDKIARYGLALNDDLVWC